MILHHVGGREDDLSEDNPILHLLQSVRDEAHTDLPLQATVKLAC